MKKFFVRLMLFVVVFLIAAFFLHRTVEDYVKPDKGQPWVEVKSESQITRSHPITHSGFMRKGIDQWNDEVREEYAKGGDGTYVLQKIVVIERHYPFFWQTPEKDPPQPEIKERAIFEKK